jgi:5-methylcytosine-specific restriction endonuclease McrA
MKRYIKNIWYMLRFAWEGGLALQDGHSSYCKKCQDTQHKRRAKARTKRSKAKSRNLHKNEARARERRENAIPTAIFIEGAIPIELVLPHVRTVNGWIQVGNEKAQVVSRILRLMKKKGCVCAACNRKATHAMLRYDREIPYITSGFWGDDGAWYHMTVDHNIPRAQAGPNTQDNLLVMCNECNNTKGNRTLEEFRGIMKTRNETPQEFAK